MSHLKLPVFPISVLNSKLNSSAGKGTYKYINIIIYLNLVLTVLGPSFQLTLCCYKHTLLHCM